MKKRIIVNTVPHSGTHLVSSILDIIGYSHALQFHWKTLSFGKVVLNWRTSLLPGNNGVNNTENKFYVSVASPQLVRADLIKNIIKKIKNNKYLLSHIPHSDIFANILTELNFTGITIIRDPRDMILSMLNHIETRPHHFAFDTLFDKLATRRERLEAIADGTIIFNTDGNRSFGNLKQMMNSILPWAKADNFIFLKFEDLVGAMGGGSADVQFQSIQRILNHLNGDHLDIEEIAKNCFGKSGTFRKGKINRWKTEMNVDEKEIFKKYDDCIVSLGYEPTV
jgi:hypothetical protein